MKIYAVIEKECEYNDSTYDLRDGGSAVKAFKERKNADEACREMNEAKHKSGNYPVGYDGDCDAEYFRVDEVEVADADVQGYADARSVIKRLKDEAQKLMKDAFRKGADEIFQKHPKLESFSWTQYTPYFNDGDACEFGVCNDEMNFKYDGVEHEYIGLWSLESNGTLNDFAAAAKDALEFVHKFDEDDYYQSFGDHAEVIVSRDGIGVEEYQHD